MPAVQNDVVPPDQAVPATEFWRRVAWIGVRLVLVYCMVDEFQPFFYQAF